jgi:hypothetical protein
LPDITKQLYIRHNSDNSIKHLMLSGLKQSIILIIGIFFLLSVSEISTSFVKNTFDDEYDTYIQPDNSHTTDIAVKTFFFFALIAIPAVFVFIRQEAVVYFHFINFVNLLFPPPLYLKHRVLLI